MTGFLIGFLTVIHVLVALFVIVLVLMQKSSDQGVGAAFGGGVTDQVFGGGTTTALVRMTIWCAGILLATTLLLAVLHAKRGTAPGLMRRVTQTAPALPPNPSLPLTTQPTQQQPAQTPAAPISPATPPSSAGTTEQTPPPAAPAASPAAEQPKTSP